MTDEQLNLDDKNDLQIMLGTVGESIRQKIQKFLSVPVRVKKSGNKLTCILPETASVSDALKNIVVMGILASDWEKQSSFGDLRFSYADNAKLLHLKFEQGEHFFVVEIR